MSRVFDALRKSESQGVDSSLIPPEAFFNTIEKAEELPAVPTEQVQILPKSRVVVYTDPRSPGAERFRLVRMGLREMQKAANLKTLLITSPLPNDGKSTVALNLAASLTEKAKRKVLLLEADLHHPTLGERLGLKPWSGLSECLQVGFDPISAVRRIEPLGFYLLPAGRPPGNPTEVLQSERFAQLLQSLTVCFDWILIDSPPATPLADAKTLRAHVDAILLVVRAGRTPREAVEETIQLLGQRYVLGVILNAVDGLERLYSQYYGREPQKTENKSRRKG